MKRITVEKIVTDVYFTGVKLPNGCGGISCTPTTDLHCPCCSILTMGQKRGASKGAVVYDILASPPVSSLITAARIKISILKNSREVIRQI